MPYAQYVGDSNPVDLLNQTLEEYRDAAALLSDASWNQPWTKGKWTLREIMIHVAQWEMIFGYRLSAGVSAPPFTIQPADQDLLMKHISGIDGPAAFAGFEGARRMNLGFVRALSPLERSTPVHHPEFGAITADDLIVQMTGHAIHHLKQIRTALGPRTDDVSS